MRRLHRERNQLVGRPASRAASTPSVLTLPVLTLSGLTLSVLTLVGCSSGLETGYVPRPLGATATERRGYYASPFTPEAAAAAQNQNDPAADVRSVRKPGGGYRGP